ncbi:Uu.00g031070.m01.CDS01 [Anthostomella pinea]|uniref:Uu.00g031070.m01.CDS01 n=1 Tax=Anthostomella pinea TaxID=933095 RepID=A0AAI8V8F0_9PEZI|nr:Uu.00g031070.m01.CDS01 [Anthostomella pinea]
MALMFWFRRSFAGFKKTFERPSTGPEESEDAAKPPARGPTTITTMTETPPSGRSPSPTPTPTPSPMTAPAPHQQQPTPTPTPKPTPKSLPSLPSAPPLSLALQAEPRTSPDASSSPRSHQRYLDSLQPPSEKDFARLATLQEQREREHRHRNHELQRQTVATSQKSMEARRDFMHTKAVDGDKKAAAHRHSLLGHIHSNSLSRSRPGSKDAQAGEGADPDHDLMQSKAATVIQRNYRGYRLRREMQGLGLDPSTRWTHAIRDAQWKELTTPRPRGDSSLNPTNEDANGDTRPSTSRSAARRNWMKIATIAQRAAADEDSDHSKCSSSAPPTDEEPERTTPEQREAARKRRMKAQAKRREHAKMMGLQYFLEMVDLKHRYGSNLRTYHEEWKKSDTNENFFYWLDYGEGKNIDLAACPHERLDREQVRYLNREERQHYLVKVDLEGRLVWAKNGVRIDTTEEWKDSIHGIVPVDDPTPAFAPAIEEHTQAKPNIDSPPEPHSHNRQPSSGSDSDSSRESELEAAMAAKYANPGLDNAKGAKKVRHVSAATIFNKLLRKSVRKNTWIFVADTSFRLYVGIKNSGAFQHSSFLRGSRISAAGLIKVKNGRLSSLSPLSGHYRPPASNFRAFVHSLEDEGVDMSHVSISKSYAVLVGLEAYIKTQKKGKEALQKLTHQKEKILAPEEARKKEEAQLDSSQSAAIERKVLRKEEVLRVENKASVRFLQKLGVRPRTPVGQQNGEGETVEALGTTG